MASCEARGISSLRFLTKGDVSGLENWSWWQGGYRGEPPTAGRNKEAGPWAEVETSPQEEAPLLSTSHA